jgi:hypothetical protein
MVLGACSSDGGSPFSLDDLNSLMDATTQVLNLATGIAGGGGGGGSLPSFNTAPRAGQVAPPSGYSQRGAFEDCATLFEQAGDASGAAKCRTRASNMETAH